MRRKRDVTIFAEYWMKNDACFSPIKEQYEKMLNKVTLDRAKQWKISLGIDN